MQKINLRQKLALFSDYWKPKIIADLNGQHVKLVKFRGEFVWHHHETEDELFLVVAGRFRMEFRDRHEWIEPGELERLRTEHRDGVADHTRKLRALLALAVWTEQFGAELG